MLVDVEEDLTVGAAGSPSRVAAHRNSKVAVVVVEVDVAAKLARAKSRGTPLNRLIEDMTTVMLAEFDAETRFQLRASRGAGQEATGLKLLDKAKAS